MYDLLTLRKNKSLMYRLRKDYRIVRARGGASILGLAARLSLLGGRLKKLAGSARSFARAGGQKARIWRA